MSSSAPGGGAARVPPPLPPEALQCIAGHAGSAQVFLVMASVCQPWAQALRGADHVWKQMALARFPRLASIIRLTPANRAMEICWRDHYRRQLEAECGDKGSWRPKLSDFILTLEVWYDAKIAAEWSGHPQDCCPDGGSQDGLPHRDSARLWEESETPDWYVCRARDADIHLPALDDEQYTDCIEKVGGDRARVRPAACRRAGLR